MGPIEITREQQQVVERNARDYYNTSRQVTIQRTSKFFGYLMLAQWAGAIILSLAVAPKTWVGTASSIHIHVWTAIFLGGAISIFPAYLGLRHPGRAITRHVISAAQMLTSGLLVHLSGGRIETHFHIFGSLALLAFYGEWSVLLTATLVTGLDHVVRGVFFPLSIYGVAYSSLWRSFEHAAWVVYENTFLVWACFVTKKDVREVAMKRAELIHAQDAIREREERMQAILDTAADAIITLDGNLEINSVNAAAERLWGWTSRELIGKLINEFIQPTSRDVLRNALEKFQTNDLAEGRVANCSLQARTKDDSAPTIELAIGAMNINSQRMYTLIARDVTQRRMMEIQLHQAQKLESIGQLAAGIAHEINTPIQFVGDNTRFLQDEFGNIKALLDGCTKFIGSMPHDDGAVGTQVKEMNEVLKSVDSAYLFEEIPKALKQSLDGISRVTKIVRAMKEFSHPGTTEKQSLDINKAIESTIVISTNEWKYVADVEMNFDQNLPLVPCLPGEFNQVILNLLVNSAHALADVKERGPTGKGKIKVSTLKSGDWVEIRLQDNGVGIPKEIANKVFDPFFTTKEVGKGTGQGLAIARTIIANKHGGTINFESEPGQGTTFIIRLPLKDHSGDARSSRQSRNASEMSV